MDVAAQTLEDLQVLTLGPLSGETEFIMKIFFRSVLVLLVMGCASKVLEYDHPEKFESNKDYESKFKVKELPVEPVQVESGTSSLVVKPTPAPTQRAELKPEPKRRREVKPVLKAAAKPPKVKGREPEMEDTEGFNGRRPEVDPYRVGEKVSLALSYFNVTAGTMDLEVLPFVQVNGAKSYSFSITVQSSSLFSRFYSVDDRATTYVNYNTLIPYNFEIKIKESKQLGTVTSYFDWPKQKALYWEKKVTKEKGEVERKQEWEVEPFSQNVISAVYYLRSFQLRPGKKLGFRVADDGKNLVFNAEVLRREKLDTEVGELDTVVVKPTITVDGLFKPVGDILLWLSDDDRKFVVRIESKIRIGTIVGKLKALHPGP